MGPFCDIYFRESLRIRSVLIKGHLTWQMRDTAVFVEVSSMIMSVRYELHHGMSHIKLTGVCEEIWT